MKSPVKGISSNGNSDGRCARFIQRVMRLTVEAAVALAVGCHAGPPAPEPIPVTSFYGSLSSVMAQMDDADIQKDVDAALRRGDCRPLGVTGIGLVVPGIDRQTLATMQTEVEVIPYTGDNIYSAQLMAYQDIAYRYAERYNRVLLTKIRHPQTRPTR